MKSVKIALKNRMITLKVRDKTLGRHLEFFSFFFEITNISNVCIIKYIMETKEIPQNVYTHFE